MKRTTQISSPISKLYFNWCLTKKLEWQTARRSLTQRNRKVSRMKPFLDYLPNVSKFIEDFLEYRLKST